MKELGIVEWRCGRGCSRGQPYGEHGDCGMRVIKTIGGFPDADVPPKYPTIAAALAAPETPMGWNLRCQICGTFGAGWKQIPRRNSVPLCPRDMKLIDELEALPKKLMQTDVKQLSRSEVDKEFAAYHKEQRAKRRERAAAERAEERQVREARAAARAASRLETLEVFPDGITE